MNLRVVLENLEFSAAHRIKGHKKCGHVHGHNWFIPRLILKGKIKKNGMVADFGDIKGFLKNLDHKDITDRYEGQPTLERITEDLVKAIEDLFDVKVIYLKIHETRNCSIEYRYQEQDAHVEN